MNRERIIERVRKILRLATSPEPEEAMRAQEEAARLMAKYDLSDEDVCEDASLLACSETDIHHRELAAAIGFLLDVRVFASDAGVLFRGYPKTVERATEFLRVLYAQAQAHAQIPAEVYSGFGFGHAHVDWSLCDRAWRACFMTGFVGEVAGRLRAARDLERANHTTTQAPQIAEAKALIDQATDQVQQPRDVLERFKRTGIDKGKSYGAKVAITVPPEPGREATLLLS